MRRNRIRKFLDNDDTPARTRARYKISSSLEERLYATTDANHNVTSVDDVFGAVKERLVYDPYRQSTVRSAAWATTSDTLAWSIRSQGEREDATTNTIDGRNRLYGIGMGRWMQADPAGYIDGANRYQFTSSSPASFVDPLGLWTRPDRDPGFDVIVYRLPRTFASG
jgi:RHS repeat-associated protein